MARFQERPGKFQNDQKWAGVTAINRGPPPSTPALVLSTHRDAQHSRLVFLVNTQPHSHSIGLAIAKASVGFPGRDSQAYLYLSWQYKPQPTAHRLRVGCLCRVTSTAVQPHAVGQVSQCQSPAPRRETWPPSRTDTRRFCVPPSPFVLESPWQASATRWIKNQGGEDVHFRAAAPRVAWPLTCTQNM